MINPESLPGRMMQHSKNGVHLFVNPHWGGKFVTDDTGAKVMALMAQEPDEDNVTELIASELGINAFEAAARYLAFSENLKKRNLLGEAPAVESGLPKPDVGFLEITRQCHTRCRLCYVSSGEKQTDTLSRDDVFRAVDQMADMGITFIALSGGDPLAREDFLEILRYIRERHGITPGLSTSLLALEDEVTKVLRDLGTVVQVSLDGSCAEMNDWNRGAGTFEKAIGGVEMLKKHEIPFRFAYVINRHNVRDVENMVSLAAKMGAKEIAFGKVKLAGRASEVDGEAAPEVADMAAAYHTLYRSQILNRQSDFVVRCKHNQPLVTGLQDRVGYLPCGAGRTFVHVSHNGDILPCSLLSNQREFRIGNVKTDRLEDVWIKSAVYDFFRTSTVEDIEACTDCAVKNLCGGGCRADAYLRTGDIHGRCGDCDDLEYYYDWILDRGCQKKFVTSF